MKFLRLSLALVLAAMAVVLLRPAAADAAPPEMTLELQAPDTSRVGTQVTLVSVITDTEPVPSPSPSGGDSVAPLSGFAIVFSSSSGWRSGLRYTDSEGSARFTYTGPIVATEILTAAVVSEGCETVVSNSVTLQWQAAPTIFLSPQNQHLSIQATATIEARVIGNGAQNAELEVTVSNSNYSSRPVEVGAPKDGTRTISIQAPPGSSADTVTVRFKDGSNTDEPAVASILWSAGDESGLISLFQRSNRSTEVGETIVLAAREIEPSLSAQALPSGASMIFYSLDDGWSSGPVTPVNGVFTTERTRNTPGVETLLAVIYTSKPRLSALPSPPPGKQLWASAVTTHTWWEPDVTVTPAYGTSVQGGESRILATLSHNGNGLSGRELDFIAESQDDEVDDLEQTRTTDALGQALFSWSREAAGADDLGVAEVGRSNSGSFSNWYWVDRPGDEDVTLSQSNSDGRLGSSVDLTAEVTDFDGEITNPAVGEQVRFVGPDTSSGSLSTDDDGTATYAYTASQPTAQELRAEVERLGCTLARSDPVEHTWWLPDLSLTPAEDTLRVNRTTSATARLSQEDAGLADRQLLFTRRDVTGRLREQSVRLTGADGRTTYTWTSSRSGTDTVTVEEIGVPQPRTASARRTWTSLPNDDDDDDDGDDPPGRTPVTPDPGEQPQPGPDPDDDTSEPPPDDETPTPEVTPTPTPTSTATPPPTAVSLDPSSETGQVGGSLRVSGSGCVPNEAVRITVGEERVGTVLADGDGSFELRIPTPDLPLGRYTLRATCGDRVATDDVDLTLASSTTGRAGAAGATTGAVLLFFMLLGNAILTGLHSRS